AEALDGLRLRPLCRACQECRASAPHWARLQHDAQPQIGRMTGEVRLAAAQSLKTATPRRGAASQALTNGPLTRFRHDVAITQRSPLWGGVRGGGGCCCGICASTATPPPTPPPPPPPHPPTPPP